MPLQIHLDCAKVAILCSAVLVSCHKFDEESLVEGFVGLILPDEERALVATRLVSLPAWGSRLLKDYHWLKLLVERPEDLLERVDDLVVEENKQLLEHLNPAFVLGQ